MSKTRWRITLAMLAMMVATGGRCDDKLIDMWVLKKGYPRFTDKWEGAAVEQLTIDLQGGVVTMKKHSEQLKGEVTHTVKFTPMPKKVKWGDEIPMTADGTGMNHECVDQMFVFRMLMFRGTEMIGQVGIGSDKSAHNIQIGWVEKSAFRTVFDIPELKFMLGSYNPDGVWAEWVYERKKVDPSRSTDEEERVWRLSQLSAYAEQADQLRLEHEFWNPEEGMTRLPNTAYPDFFCHDFAFAAADRRYEAPDPSHPLFEGAHLNANRILENPGKYSYAEIFNYDDAQPGDVVVYMNNADTPNVAYHSALVVRNDGKGWGFIVLHSKDGTNSVFEHRLGGKPNFFMSRYGGHGIRIFRRVVK